MSPPVVPADELFQIIASQNSSNETKLELITQLKTHVKKDFVDITQVPKYAEALSIAVDISDYGISANSFSVLSHLVKRVSMQDKTGEVLKGQSFLILPILINRLSDSKSSTINSAKKALEAYWLSAPKQVEEALIDIALKHRNTKVIIESINWLSNIVNNINPHFKLDYFLPHLVKLLSLYNNNGHTNLIESVKGLLSSYYSYRHNHLYRFDLSRELELQNISIPLRDSIMNEIDSSNPESKSPIPSSTIESNFVLAGTTRVTVNQQSSDYNQNEKISIKSASLPSSVKYSHAIARPKSRSQLHSKSISPSVESTTKNIERHEVQVLDNHSTSTETNNNSQLNEITRSFDIAPDIQKLVANLNYNIDESIPPISVTNADQLYNIINEILPAFNNKETEFNWASREKSIIKLRSILRGNASKNYCTDLILCIKEVSEAICKAITSLRTTLCSHGCHLVKECAIILESRFDSLIDLFLPTLIKLCSATKHIASTNANMSLCAIFINISYNHRLLQRVLASSNEKNVSPRSYSGLWLQIILLRFHDDHSFLSAHGGASSSGVEISIKILVKLLGDPNPTVRQIAKDSFWCFWRKFPNEAESLLSRLDSNVVKAIERSRPKNTNSSIGTTAPTLTIKKSRPSLKESIIARNKDLRIKQREKLGSSRPSSRTNSETSTYQYDIKGHDKSRLGGPKRNNSQSSLSKLEFQRHTSLERNNQFHNNNLDIKPSSIKKPAPIEIRSNDELKDTIDEDHQKIKATKTIETDLTFDKQSDPILKFLSSNQTDLITEGINLLKYAIMGEEDLSSEVNDLLKKISIRQPNLLQPLFLTTDILFKKSYQFFKPDDFFRVCSILVNPVEDKAVDLIISVIDVEDIYDSITKLLSYTISMSNIVDDGELTMQIIKYKSTIIRMIVDFLNKGLNKIPISDSYFSKLTSCLFELVGLLKSTELYKSFSDLLAKLYSINPTLFISELEMTDANTKEEVEYIVGIDGTLNLSKSIGNSTNHLSSLFDLTKVNPIQDLDKFSPVKVSADFTMLMPVIKDNNEYTFIPKKSEVQVSSNDSIDSMNIDESSKETNPIQPNISTIQKTEEANSVNLDTEPIFYKVVEDNIDLEEDIEDPMEVDKNHPDNEKIENGIALKSKLNEQEANNELNSNDGVVEMNDYNQNYDIEDKSNDEHKSLMENQIAEEKNIFVDSNINGSKSDLFAKFSRMDSSSELAEDFAQVQITELSNKMDNKDKIQSYIDKIDPLNKISSKNKPITIYEDDNVNGSPQKVKDYSYSELNWFNFQVAKYAVHQLDEEDDKEDFSIVKFEMLCDHLSTQTIDGKQFIAILNYLQNINNCTLEFSNYFHTSGKSMIEGSLWNFFNCYTKLSQSKILSGLILLKQLLINRLDINLDNLWDLLVKLSVESTEQLSELSHAISETYDEMLSGLFSSQDIFSVVLSSLKNTKNRDNPKSLLFVLESLSKLLNMSSITLFINENLVIQIDEILHIFMNNEKVEIRRCVISSYGKLLKASRNSNSVDMNKIERPNDKNIMDGILKRLSIPQKKLVEYYSQI